MLLNDDLQNILEKEAKEGWIFKKISNSMLKFKKEEPQDIKYQIDFSSPTQEYKEILKQDGYEFVDNFTELSIYKNNNINAYDLQTDETTRLLSLERMFTPKHPIIFFLVNVFYLCILEFFRLIVFDSLRSLGTILQSIDVWCIYLILLLLFLVEIFITLEQYLYKCIVHCQLQQKKYYLLPTKIIEIIIKILSIIMIILGIYILVSQIFDNHWIDFIVKTLILYGIITLFRYMITKIAYRIESEPMQKIVKIVTFILYICAFTFVSSTEISKETKNNIKPYMNDTQINQDIYSNIFYTSYVSTIEDFDTIYKKEEYEVCLNDFIAKEIFKSEISYYERETRMPTQEEIDKITEETGEWSSNDVPYQSYENAIETYHKYSNSLVDECYYNDLVFIARKDQTILISYLQNEDNYIDQVLNHYFK